MHTTGDSYSFVLNMERRGDYKYQARADYNKTERSKTMDVKRKQQRCNLMMHNRRIPLEEKNEIVETAVSKGSW